MARFLLFVIPLTILVMGVASFAFDAFDGGDFGPRLEGNVVLAGWLLESTALAALFLLIQGRGGSWWLDGLLAAWLAWIFRGPVLVLAVAEVLGRYGDPWWPLTLRSLLVYSFCGLLLALLARRLGVRR